MEFDFEVPYAKEFLASTGMSRKRIRQLFSPSEDLLLSPGYRTAFCHECVLADVQQKRFPSWRKSWCYVARPYCEEHKCLLRFMHGHKGSDKQWNAFTKLDLGEFMPGRLAGKPRTGHGVPPSPARTHLTLRMQAWVQRVYSSAACVPRRGDHPIDNHLMRTAIDLMLRLTLTHRTRRVPAGMAKTGFSSFYPPIDNQGLDLPSRLENGSPNSVPYERMCALWLLGKVFKVFTAPESALLHRMVSEADFFFPTGLGELGERCRSGLIEDEGEVFADLVSRLNVEQVFDRDFLEGLLGKS